ncbi:unnamed protein product [Ceutorhynchus assimilis]|uniref:Nuclear pore complex protein n=1 Tax=Ceutorhynchus assimilis TaxID=467358 RepID=A0A9N9MWU4_9CUCU|nr:unnamed protein product [Ceutorhynchus assimilis]
MDNDLNRSVRFLEEALSTPSRRLHKKPAPQRRSDWIEDVTYVMAPHEIENLMHCQSFYDQTMNDLMHVNRTLTGEVLQHQNPWTSTVDRLYIEFFEVLQGQSEAQDSLETLAELARCCSDALNVLKGLKSQVAVGALEEEKWLEKERDTWRLLFILYQDRLMSQNSIEQIDQVQYFGKSERNCVQNLFKRDNLIRECQLVIDWLEAEACGKDEKVLHIPDAVGWENTLHQIESNKNLAFGSSRPVVDQMDPDAPHYLKKSLHDLDMEADEGLSRKIFKEIRCGRLEEAQKLASQCGHSWKAAIFEGWRLFHNPNIKENDCAEISDDDGYEERSSNEFKDIEGNGSRDIWKIMALRYSKQDWINPYDKASVATFCGYIEAILPVCSTWEDNLWAYMKSIVDIRVESEIRDCCTKNNSYLPLPEEYWLQRQSLNDVFSNLASSENRVVREEAKEPQHVVQKHIVLDEIMVLLKELEEWSESANVSTQFLRFAAHLVLFLDQIGQANRRDCVEAVVEAYIKRLMMMGETQLVAYYVSKLNTLSQVHIYAKHLETILEHEQRKEALKFAEECGLDVLAITKQIVENIRQKSSDLNLNTILQKTITESDKLKISAIDWLIFYESQRSELLAQSNAIIFYFLILGKLDAAQLAFNKIPNDAVETVISEVGDSNEEINKIIKEHLGYKVYLESYEAFNEWFKQAKNKPVVPDQLHENAQFPEKVAHQHRLSQHKAEVERWKLTTTHLAKTAKTLLYNVLLFPEGWLSEANEGAHIRKMIIPEVTFLLCTVLYESEMYEKCVQLADIVASERFCLYKEFNKQQLGRFLTEVGEASKVLTELKKDPWGNDMTA